MKKYTVLWEAELESGFTDAWVKGDAKLRAVLTEIANWVDKNLSTNPAQQGQVHRELDARLLIVPIASSVAEVAVFYQVDERDRVVRVERLTFKIAD